MIEIAEHFVHLVVRFEVAFTFEHHVVSAVDTGNVVRFDDFDLNLKKGQNIFCCYSF